MGRRAKGEGTIFKDSNNYYVARVAVGKDPETGKTKHKVFKSTKKSTVVEKMNAYKLLAAQGFGSVDPTSLDVFMRSWLENVKSNELKPTSYDRAERTIEINILPRIGHYSIGKLTPEIIQAELINDMRDTPSPSTHKPYSFSTINKAYVYVDGIYLRRNWGGEFENVAILVAIAVNEDGYREILGAAEGMKEDKASWVSFFQWLRGRGLDGVKLIVGDKCLGMLEAVGEVFPEAKYQRCTVHFYRNVFSVTPRSKVKLVAKMLKAIHAQESKKAAREKAKVVVEELRAMKLKEAARKVEDGIEETLTYCDFPSEHWTRIRTNNVIERLNREIRRRTRVVGTFPDGNSALMLVCARLRHVAGTQWGNKKYMNMKHLEAAVEDASIAG